MKLSFLSLASGSSGNCYYLGTPEFGVLIDAGIGIRTIKKVLKDHGLDFDKIVAVLVRMTMPTISRPSATWVRR